MPSQDAELIQHIAQDINRYLDGLQRPLWLWADVDNHVAASHIAESLGDCALVSLHLQAVTRLLAEIYLEYPLQAPPRKKRRPIIMRSPRLRRVPRALFGPTRSV